jgi:hypothetical protein
MRMPKKLGAKAYQEMLEARPDRNTTSRWLPVLEEWERDTPPPRGRKRPNALERNPFKKQG